MSDASKSNKLDNAYSSAVPDSPTKVAKVGRPLRWLPAVIILVLMLGLRAIPKVFESIPFPVLMASFMGPALLALAILIWWVFASRASLLEKMIGLVGVIALVVVSVSQSHPSMQGMPTILMVFPTGIAAFAIGALLATSIPNIRVVSALVLSGIVFGYWSQLKNAGFSGDFQPELSWRWEKTAEERYIAKKPLESQPHDAATEKVTLASSEWPSFRGPERDGKMPGITLSEDWKTSPPKLIWKKMIGPGWSSFTVAGKRLFTQEQRGENEAVVCLNADTGDTIWAYEYKSRFTEAIAGAGPRATPTIADEGLFTLGAHGILLRLNPVTGESVWERDLRIDADREPPTWGFSASPLVEAGLVIVHAGGKADKGVLAYDVNNGDLKWSAPSGDHSYSSPHLATFDQVRGVLMESNYGLQFLDIKTGETIWEHKFEVNNYRCLQPLVLGNSIYIATSLGGGTRRITVKHEGDKWNVVEDWTSRDMNPDFNDFVEYQGNIYGFNARIFGSINAETGKLNWKKGRYGNGQVLLLPDSGQLLVTAESGELALVDADPKEFHETAKFKAIEGKTWNHSVLIGNRVYVRNAEEVACFELPRATANQ